ncbi:MULTISPECIES: ester cyclase [unclassified Sphingomonas]|nr:MULTISPECIES: ester cyclase [unclassified Sphingomonas]
MLALAGFTARLVQSRAAFPDQRFEIQGLFADEGAVTMAWLWSATHLGDLPGFPASGKTIRMSGLTIYGFDDRDRLTGHWQVTDRLGVYQQLQRNAAAG